MLAVAVGLAAVDCVAVVRVPVVLVVFTARLVPFGNPGAVFLDEEIADKPDREKDEDLVDEKLSNGHLVAENVEQQAERKGEAHQVDGTEQRAHGVLAKVVHVTSPFCGWFRDIGNFSWLA